MGEEFEFFGKKGAFDGDGNIRRNSALMEILLDVSIGRYILGPETRFWLHFSNIMQFGGRERDRESGIAHHHRRRVRPQLLLFSSIAGYSNFHCHLWPNLFDIFK